MELMKQGFDWSADISTHQWSESPTYKTALGPGSVFRCQVRRHGSYNSAIILFKTLLNDSREK